MKSSDEVLIWIVGLLIVASITWLVKEVLALRNDLTKLQTETQLQIKQITQNCARHQHWAEGIQKSMGRMDRNLIRLCSKQEVEFESPSDEDNSTPNIGGEEHEG
jgi:hypothetical protein